MLSSLYVAVVIVLIVACAVVVIVIVCGSGGGGESPSLCGVASVPSMFGTEAEHYIIK